MGAGGADGAAGATGTPGAAGAAGAAGAEPAPACTNCSSLPATGVAVTNKPITIPELTMWRTNALMVESSRRRAAGHVPPVRRFVRSLAKSHGPRLRLKSLHDALASARHEPTL